jgi:hypothetical protein
MDEKIKKAESTQEHFRTKGEKDRKNIGEISQELLAKQPDTNDPIELQQAMQYDSFEDEFFAAVERGKKKYVQDFYIVVLNQRFRLFTNVIRTYFIDRLSCPTPDYDQSVYKFHRKKDEIEFLWVVPDKQTCEDMRDDALMIPPEMWTLLQFVLHFYDGTLLNKCKLLNQEEKQSLVLVA